MVSELLWPVHTFGPRGRSNRTGALLVVNQDAGNAQLGGTRLVLSPLTAHLNAVFQLDRYHFSGQSNTLMAHQPKQSIKKWY